MNVHLNLNHVKRGTEYQSLRMCSYKVVYIKWYG